MTKKMIRMEIDTVLIQMGISPGAITEKASYYRDLGMDSLDFAELIIEFEARLNLKINEMDIENLTTIKETVNYLDQLVNADKAFV